MANFKRSGDMESCGDVSSRKRNRPHMKKLCLALAALAAVGMIWLVVSVNDRMRPALASLAETRIKSLATDAMNQAINESLNSGPDYDRLITSYDNGEKVYMLQADARRMNLLASECCAAAQKRIAQIGEQGVSLPLGTVSGITYLTGRGPRIRVTFTPAGSVYSEFCSTLSSSGINQSLYRVNLRLTASIRLIMPGISRSIEVSSEAAIAESIIVGEVPQVYTNVESTDDMLNLVPTEPLD